MNFSKYKLQNYLREDATAEDNSEMASQKSSDSASMRNDRKSKVLSQTNYAHSQKQTTSRSNTTFTASFDMDQHFKDVRSEKEQIKAMEAKKSDWRQELQEKVVDGQEREKHPYVTVMPTGDENLIQAVKQMAKTAKDKKDSVTEETELDEAKKKCKDGYEYDSKEKKCKKKKKSSTKTVVYGGRYGFGGHHHHHHDDDDDNGGSGDSGGNGDSGDGGVSEMLDYLGDLFLEESERMARLRKEYDDALKQPSPHANMTDKQKKQMTKATRSTRNYK